MVRHTFFPSSFVYSLSEPAPSLPAAEALVSIEEDVDILNDLPTPMLQGFPICLVDTESKHAVVSDL